MADRLSQEAIEVLESIAAAKARLSQEAIEVLETPPSKARLSQIAIEVLVAVRYEPRNPTINHQNPGFF